jgi:hypothetical protein
VNRAEHEQNMNDKALQGNGQMNATKEFVTPREFVAYVESRGYAAAPITNTTAAASGADLEIVGYELRGPRGNKTVVGKTDGKLPLFDARLWADGVDYATRKIKNR